MADSLFDISDEDLEARRRAAIFERSQALSRGFKRPAQAQAGAMLGGALAKTIFGLKGPEENELAKRASLQKYMQSTGIDPGRNPEAYYAAAAQAALKFGMPQVADRASQKLESLKGTRVDQGFKQRGIELQEEGIAVDREQLSEQRRANMSREDFTRAQNTWSPAAEDKVWGPKVAVLPEYMRNLVQVNRLGEIDPTGKALLAKFGGGGGGNQTDPLKPSEVRVTPEDALEIQGLVIDTPEMRALAEGWFNGSEITEVGKRESVQLAQAARLIQAEDYGSGKDSRSLGSAAQEVMDFKNKHPAMSWSEIHAFLNWRRERARGK